jgi:hypothetical protein
MTRTPLTQQLRRPRALCWVLLVAVLFAMAPTLGRVLAFAGVTGAQRMEICSTQGPQALVADSGKAAPGPAQEPAAAQSHCPFCLHQADRLLALPARVPEFLAVHSEQQEVPVRLAFFYARQTSLWAPPRGPPTAFTH